MGVPLMRTKTWAYAAGAFFGGVAGAYYGSFKGGTFPGDFYFNISVFILCMVILGGMGNVWGVIVGAAFLSYLNQEGLANIGAWMNANGAATSCFASRSTCRSTRRDLRCHPRADDALQARRAASRAQRRKLEFHEGVHDEYLYDVEHHDEPLYDRDDA